MNIVVDRSPRDAAVAIGAAWLALLAALPFFEAGRTDLGGMLIGGLMGAGLIVAGFAAASRVRPMRSREGRERVRLALLAIASGAALGVVNLAANVGMAAAHPTLDQLLRERFAALSPWATTFAAPVLEEIAYRLFFLSVLAWLVARFTKNPRAIFLVSLGVTALVFGVMHLFRPMPDQASVALLYGAGIVLKIGAVSLLLGWLFWRWGLPYAMLAHAAANAAHELLDPLFFA